MSKQEELTGTHRFNVQVSGTIRVVAWILKHKSNWTYIIQKNNNKANNKE